MPEGTIVNVVIGNVTFRKSRKKTQHFLFGIQARVYIIVKTALDDMNR
jgi:hypothetical protein